jgi:hypothetical protein
MLLRCPKMKKRRELVCNKSLNINDGIASRKIINCTYITKTKSSGKYLLENKCNWKMKNGKTAILAVSWKLQYK